MLLYYITDRTQFPGDEASRRRALLGKITEASHCGVDYIQLREKDLCGHELERLACEAVAAVRESLRLRAGARELRTALLINSRTDVALSAEADGVHLRSDDILPPDVRSIWGAQRTDRAIVAVSCHAADEVKRAADQGATFAVFGPVFAKAHGPAAPYPGVEGLCEACRHSLPVLALGGVTLKNFRSCIDAGAAGIAAIRLFQEHDVANVVAALRGFQ